MGIKFSKKTIPFLTKAGQQSDPEWLTAHQTEYDALVKLPFIELAEHLKQAMQPDAADYHFPTKGIGRIKRMANKVMPGEPHYKDWLSLSASRPSDSRFERNPHLFFGILPNEAPWNGVIVSGGLFMPSGPQLKKMRNAIAEDAKPFHTLFKDKKFKTCFKESFSTFNVSSRAPRGFDPGHSEMNWLRLKSFLVVKKISMTEFTSPDLADSLVTDFKQLLRLNRLIEDIVID